MHFIERIMLAVTEVNDCDICSYGHTKIALEQDMSEVEIKMLLPGETDNVPTEELHAVMFAQHYANAEGKPSQVAWEKLIKEYGTDRAYGILGGTRMIMFRNTYSISLGNVKNSFSKNKSKQSSLIRDLARTLNVVILLPAAINRLIIKEPLITFLKVLKY